MTSEEIRAKVAEARPQDARRSIARIDPELVEGSGLQTGDIVFIEGDRRTVAAVYPGYPQDTGTGIVRMDGATRSNAGAGIDDHVTITPADTRDATEVSLAPSVGLRGSGLTRLVLNQLSGRPVTQGDTVNLDVLGHQVSLVVTGYSPTGDSVLITPSTQVEISEEPAQEAQPTERHPGHLRGHRRSRR